MDMESTRVQLRRLPDRDREGALAYKWRTTLLRGPGRRSLTEGVLLAHPEQGLVRVGPDVEGWLTAGAVLADERRRTGRLPHRVDLVLPGRVDESRFDTSGDRSARRERYDLGRGYETLGEAVARQRREEREARRHQR
ncbi:MAG: hypothetical protein ACRD2C_04260 [Acidimicrobiales bacterium]